MFLIYKWIKYRSFFYYTAPKGNVCDEAGSLQANTNDKLTANTQNLYVICLMMCPTLIEANNYNLLAFNTNDKNKRNRLNAGI